MGAIIKELRAYYDAVRQLNEKGFVELRAGYLLSFLSGGGSIYLVTGDARVFFRIRERNFREELHILREGLIPKNYVEQKRTPPKVLAKMKEINFELAVTLGLLY